jgi:hypothetical protein
MKANRLWVARIAAAALVGGTIIGVDQATSARAQVGLSVGVQINSPADFYSPLASYGSWVDVNPYGRCWRPAGVDPTWRPYENGRWEWTDAGWYWASDEPWAWATYHYGNWEFDPNYGWLWIPATEWAPAWVVWREAPDYVGWAPCGPGGVAVADSSFMFVDVHHFHDHLGPREFVFNDPGIFHRSRAVGGFRRESRDFDGRRRQIAFNQGPSVENIQRVTGARFTQRPVNEVVRETRVPETARRDRGQPGNERNDRSRITGNQPVRSGQDQQRLYREAPQQQPAPTGRQEPRIYREAPAQPAPVPRQTPQVPQVQRRQSMPEVSTPPAVPRQVPEAPAQVPRRQPLPEATTPSVPRQQALPPAGVERGRAEPQVPRREEATPRAVHPPAQREQQAPAAQPRERERDKDKQGQ